MNNAVQNKPRVKGWPLGNPCNLKKFTFIDVHSTEFAFLVWIVFKTSLTPQCTDTKSESRHGAIYFVYFEFVITQITQNFDL